MQEVLALRNARAATTLASGLSRMRSVRRTEWVVAIFLLYAAAAACVLPVSGPVRLSTMATNMAILVGYVALVCADSICECRALGIVRDWVPLALILLAYREIGWLALPQHDHVREAQWVVWDRAVLGGGGKALIEAFGLLLPSVLEIAYSLVYVLGPFSVAMLYIYGCRDRVDRFLCVFSASVLLCYAQLPLWPSEPPRVLFANDLPAYDTVFRCFNWWMLDKCGIHTGVFPSAHVAGAFAAAFGIRRVMPERKWVARLLFTTAVLIAVATVYGRYHYLADAAGGFLMAAFAAQIAGCLKT